MTTPLVEATQTLEQGLCAYLGDLGWTVTRTGTDLQARVADPAGTGAVIRVHRIGGQQQPYQLLARVGVEVYAATYDDLWLTSGAVTGRLVGKRFWAGRWLIDRSVNESAPAEQPHPNLRGTASVFRMTTRTV